MLSPSLRTSHPIRSRRALIALCRLVTFLAFATGAAANEPAFAWDSGVNHLVLVQPNGSIVWRFNFPPAPAKPHFHPVALPGQPPLTWVAPPDHPWHLGFWFSWKFINGVNFWETDAKTGRSDGLTHVVAIRPLARADFSARIELEIGYEPDANAGIVLHELRVIEISPPSHDGSYRFDWMMTFTAAGAPVRLDRTPLPSEPDGKPWGGYAGLTWRFAREFTEWRVVNTEDVHGEQTHGQPANACDFSGRLDGVAMGVAMVAHAENPHAPSPWYVTMDPATPFACLMPAPLFDGAHVIRPRDSFTLRYRTIVHPGRWTADRLRAETEAFTAPE